MGFHSLFTRAPRLVGRVQVKIRHDLLHSDGSPARNDDDRASRRQQRSTRMKALLLVLSLCALPLVNGTARAEQLRYSFMGTLNDSLGDLPAGTTFEGSWTLSVPQTGAPFMEGPPGASEGRQYRYDQFSLTIAGEVFVRQGADRVLVSTTDLLGDPSLLLFWPSGFSSDFSVSTGDLFPSGDVPDTRFGAKVWRIGVTFNSDGQTWNDFALPIDDALLAQMSGGVVFDTLDVGSVTGGVSQIQIAPVPLAPAWVFSVSCFAAIAVVRRHRGQSTELSARR